MGHRLIPPLGTHISFDTQVVHLFAAFGVLQQGYDHLHYWLGSGGNTRLYIHLGMQMPTICINLFGFCPRYKQDLRVVGRLFVATAGVD